MNKNKSGTAKKAGVIIGIVAAGAAIIGYSLRKAEAASDSTSNIPIPQESTKQVTEPTIPSSPPVSGGVSKDGEGKTTIITTPSESEVVKEVPVVDGKVILPTAPRAMDVVKPAESRPSLVVDQEQRPIVTTVLATGVRGKPLPPNAVARRMQTMTGTLTTATGGTRKIAGSAALFKRLKENLVNVPAARSIRVVGSRPVLKAGTSGVRGKPLPPKAVALRTKTQVAVITTKTGGTRKIAGSAALIKRLKANLGVK